MADEVGSKGWQDTAGAHFSLTFADVVKSDSAIDGRELLLRFNRPLVGQQPTALLSQLPDWLEAVDVTYDTVVLRAKRDVTWRVSTQEHGVTVDLVAASATTIPSRAEENRFALQRARVLSATGHADQARAILATLDPDDPEVIGAEAEVEARAGRTNDALEIIRRGLGEHPTDPGLEIARRSLLSTDGSNAVVTTREYAHVRNAETWRYSLIEAQPITVNPTLTVGLTGEFRNETAPDVMRSNGAVAQFDDYRERGALWAEKQFSDDLRSRLTLYGATNTLGGGIDTHLQALGGELNAGLIYHQPFWDTPEGVANNGTVDTVLAGYLASPQSWLSAAIELRGNRYAEQNIHFVGSSGGGVVEVRAEPLDQVPQLALVYNLDAEYFAHTAWRTDDSGERSQPLELRSRELHEVGFELAEDNLLVRDLYGTLFGGYAWDRLNTDGPYYGVNMGYRLIGSLELEAYANREHLGTADRPGVTTRAGVDLRFEF